MPVLLEFPALLLRVTAGTIVAAPPDQSAAVWRAATEPGARGKSVLLYKGQDVEGWTLDARMRAGLMVLFDKPYAPDGMTLAQLARLSAKDKPLKRTRQEMRRWAETLEVDAGLLDRPFNDFCWAGVEGRLEWLLAGCLGPEAIIAATAGDAPSEAAARALAAQGTGVLLVGKLA